MKGFKVLFLTLIMICIFVVSVSAAPVGTTTNVKELKGKDYIDEELKIASFAAIEGDLVNERALDKSDGEAEARFYTAKMGVSIDRVDVYAILGQARDVEYNAIVGGAQIKYDLEDQLTWGAGLSALIYEWKSLGLKFFGDAKYRTIEDMKYDSVTLEGVKYANSALTEAKTDAKWEEWQAALSVAKKFGYITPYIGLKYSDVDVSANITIDGVVYDLGTINSGQNIGAFIGCSITPIENLSLDLEARFMDEDALTIALVHEF